jgi:hypothetical protein
VWHAAMRIVAGVGDLVQWTRDGRTGRVLVGWVIKMPGDVVCGLHRARGDEEHVFHGWASKPLMRFLIGFGFKIDDDDLLVVSPQNHWDGL